MNYHGRMMNIQADANKPHATTLVYLYGHRDARHAAAEIAAEADMVIAELLNALEEVMRWFGKLEDWSGVGDPDIDAWRAVIKKAKGENHD